MTDRTKRILKLLVRGLVTAALLWLIFREIDLDALTEALARARWRYVLLSWALGVLAYWVRAERLGLILKKLGCKLATRKIFRASAVATIYSLVLPGIVGVGVKWYILRSFTGKAAQALSAMVYNQASEVLLRLLLSLVLVAATNPGGAWWMPALCLAVTVVLVAGLLLLFHPRTAARLVSISNSLLKPLPAFVREGAMKTIASSQVFASTGPGFHLNIAAINVVSTLFSAALYWCCARAIGISVPATAFVWQASVVYILGRLPISVANFGVRECTLIGFLSLYGVDAATAVVFSLLVFSNALVMAFIGLLYQLSGISRAEKAADTS
ncbi:MAG: flippase-like domain-containing protein [Phycisphaerales bacterium]|nr:MAG: flippase-like domain-containing protein [Phycisphaerales bacterium]